MRTATKAKLNLKAPMTFEQARAAYVHRFTLEHVPAWALKPMSNGRYYAPQYRSDREWFDNTQFPPNNPLARSARDTSCYSSGQTWPIGQSLDAPYVKSESRLVAGPIEVENLKGWRFVEAELCECGRKPEEC